MHPVTSELDLSLRQYERELQMQSARRESLARELARISGRQGLVSRLVDATRRFLDPRGYALAQSLRIAPPARIPRGRAATVTAMPVTTETEPALREAA